MILVAWTLASILDRPPICNLSHSHCGGVFFDMVEGSKVSSRDSS